MAEKIAGQNAAAMVANFNLRMSSARRPRQCTHGKVGTPTEDMKHKRAEAKAAKHQRPDRNYDTFTSASRRNYGKFITLINCEFTVSTVGRRTHCRRVF